MGRNIHRITPTARKGMRVSVIAAAIAGCIAHGAAYANPQGGMVTNGQATFNTQGNLLTITNTPGTIINWQNFSINANETTRFLQQSASSAVLNRIVGQNPSQILGALQSNGKVFLINPNGILFGRGAQVDTNGLVASSLNISDQDFLAGKRKFTAGANAGAVENQGTISTSSGGQVYLIAPSVTNSGIITSPEGEVILAAGHSVQLVDSGDPDLHVVVSAPQDQAVNLGQLIAHSGKVGIYGALVNQNGAVNADSAVVGKNGKIVFKASGDTILGDGSRTSATGAGTGGDVHVLGERVGLSGDAQIDASGQAGGGTVLVGGDYHGENAAIQNAKRTYIGSDAQIKADATASGNGGKVIVWSDEVTRNYGNISARGGAQGGDGGFVESSSKEMLDHLAKVDVSAPGGKGGTLLLDPAMITIVDSVGDGTSGAANDGSTTFQGSSTPGTINFADLDLAFGSSRVYQSELEQIGAGTNIVLEATDYITTSTSSFGGLVTLPLNSNLTMRTRNASTDGTGTIGINLTGSMDGPNLEFRTQGTGTITLQTGTGASPQAATIDVGKLTTAGGAITLNASGNIVLRGATTTPGSGNGGDISMTSGGYLSLGGADIDARGAGGSNGNVTLTSGDAIYMQTGKTIYADQLKMTATNGIYGSSSADPMSIQVNSLNAYNSGSGAIKIGNSGSSLSIDDLGAAPGYGVKNAAAGQAVELSSDSGFTIDIYSPISANNGAISLTGAGGINLYASTQPEISSNGGAVSLYASDSGAMISAAAGTQIGSNGGTISLMADKMQLLGGVNATNGGVVMLMPSSFGKGIDLGTVNTDLNNTLELSNSELSGITAGTVAIGNSGSGSINIKSTLTSGFPVMSLTAIGSITQQPGALLGGALSLKLKASSVNLPEANPTGVIAGSSSDGDFIYHSANGIAVSTVDGQSGLNVPGNVALISDSTNGINQSAPIVAGGLALESAGPVMLTNSGNSFNALAADLSGAASGTGNLQVFSAHDFALGSVLGINGITTNNSSINISAPSANMMTVNQPVNAGNGAVTLQAGNIALAGTAIDGSAIGLTATQAGTGTILTSGTVRIGDDAATNTTDVTLEADNLSFLQGVPVINAGHTATYVNFSDDLALSTSALAGATWNAPYLVIGNANVSDSNTTGDIVVDGALTQPGKSIMLLAGGDISQTAAIAASSLAIQSGTNTGSASSAQLNAGNAVDNIAASTNGGMFSFSDTTALNVSSITDGTHGVTGILSGNGNIGMTAASGNLTISSPVNGGTGDVSLFSSNGQVNGTGLVSANSLNAQAADGVSLQTQVANLRASNSGGVNPISIANTGTLHLGNFSQNGSGGILIHNVGSLFLDSCDCNFLAGTGGINLTTDSALTLNGMIGAGVGDFVFNAGMGAGDTLTINTNIASSGNVTLKSGDAISLTNGNVISANQLQMVAGAGIYGSASTDPMTIQVASLNAFNSGAAPIYISNSGSNLSIADIGSVGFGIKSTAAGSNINVSTTTGNTLNLSAPVSANAGTINLNGAGGMNLFASTPPEIASNGGSINLAASDAGATISTAAGAQISSSGGTVSLMADKMQLLGGINATNSGIVSLTPNSSIGIDLGAGNTDLNNTLELSNSELGGIAAGTVEIGNSGSGAIDIKSMLTSGFPVLSLTTAGAITQQPGALLGGALSLDLVGASVTLTQANPTGVIAGSATGGTFQYRSANGIAVSTVAGQQGISSAAGVVLVSDSASGINQSAPLTTGQLALQSAGPVVLNNSGNQIGLLAANVSGPGNLSVFNSNGLALNSVLGINGITTQNGNIDLSVLSSGSISALQGINAGSGSVNLNAGNIVLGSGATIDGSSIFLNTLQSAGSISTAGAGVRIGDVAATNTSDIKLEADNVNFSQGAPTFNAGHGINYSNFTDNGSISTSPLINATWNAPYFIIGNNTVAGTNTTSDITVNGALTQPGKTVVLLAGGNISQTAPITASSLAIQSGTSTGSASSVQLNSGNAVANIAASTNGGTFSFNDAAALNISSITDGTNGVTGILSGNGNVGVTTAGGDLTVSSPVTGGTGTVSLSSSNGQVNGTGLVSANSLNVQAANGISLQTQVANLSASNGAGVNPISFTNTGALHLQNFLQNGSGDITVNNAGPLFVDSGSSLTTGTGAITLTAHSPLTVNGSVGSTSGNITLFAGATGTYGAGDTLTVNGQVSTGGNITLKAGDAIVLGSSSTVTAGGTLSQTGNLNLPPLSTCISAPSTVNCNLVLPSLSVCTANPTTAGCGVVLPSLATCEVSPAIAGCSAVLPTLSTCVASPAIAGCSAVLPTMATCVASPTIAGCSAVLPTMATCVASPNTAGCSAVLPTLAACAASPTTAGCSVVLPTLAQCMAAPVLAGCAAVLPTLAQCTSDPALAGCVAVLPVAGGSSTGDVSQAIQAAVALVNISNNDITHETDNTADNGKKTDKKEEAGDHADGLSKDSGAKQNDKTQKMYCN